MSRQNGNHGFPCRLAYCRRRTCIRMIRCERPYCDEFATTLESRVDASTDFVYHCDAHLESQPSVWEPSPLDNPQLTLVTILAYWPPKHRKVTAIAARAIVGAWDR